ncbi:MAG TPA: hypothetical protein DEA08_15430 [Planctomycetes bacterium]|nr:hypothetical protein [Planctomycetota bacterium]
MVNLANTQWAGKNPCKISYKVDGKEILKDEITLSGDKGTSVKKLPKQTGNFPLTYEVTCEIEVGGEKVSPSPSFAARAGSITVCAVDEEGYDGAFDGMGLPYAYFQMQGVEGRFMLGAMDGLHEFKILGSHPETLVVQWDKPYVVDSWEEGSDIEGRTRKAKLKKAKIKPKIVKPAPGNDEIKAYVNLPSGTGDTHGRVLEIDVTAEDGADQTYYIKVTAGDENAQHDDAKNTGLMSSGITGFNSSGKVTKGSKKLNSKGEGSFSVNLGHCGGDLFTIEVGGTDACQDHKLVLRTWRRVYVQLSIPTGMETPPLNRVEDAFKDGFVEIDWYKKVTFDKTTHSGLAKHFYEGGRFYAWLEDKDFLLVKAQTIDEVHNALFEPSPIAPKLSLSVVACHCMWWGESKKEREYKFEAFADAHEGTWHDGSGPWKWVDVKPTLPFPTHRLNGDHAVQEPTWFGKDSEYQWLLPQSNVWVKTKTEFGIDEVAYRIAIPDEAVAELAQEGRWIKVAVYEYHMEEAGGTSKGNFVTQPVNYSLSDKFKDKRNQIFLDNLAHEIGHSVMMVGYPDHGLPSGAKEHDRKYPKGDADQLASHLGPHCATGLGDPDFQEIFTTPSRIEDRTECKCIMYGEEGEHKNGKFCPECVRVLKLIKMEDLT